MAYGAVDKDGSEWVFSGKPYRASEKIELTLWTCDCIVGMVKLPTGSIEKLIGKKLTWEDEPVELKDAE